MLHIFSFLSLTPGTPSVPHSLGPKLTTPMRSHLSRPLRAASGRLRMRALPLSPTQES